MNMYMRMCMYMCVYIYIYIITCVCEHMYMFLYPVTRVHINMRACVSDCVRIKGASAGSGLIC